MPTRPARKIDPQLILLDFRAGSQKLYATLQAETLQYPDAPMEFLGFARLRMSGYVSEGRFTAFEVYEQRLQQVWDRMRAIQAHEPVRFLIAAGAAITSGYQLTGPRSAKDSLPLLSIIAPPHEVQAWHPSAFVQSIKRELTAHGITGSANDAAIRHAYTLRAGFGCPVQDYRLPYGPLAIPVTSGLAYSVRADSERLFVEVQVRTPRTLLNVSALTDLSAGVAVAVSELTMMPTATPFLRTYRKEVVATLRAAAVGPEGMQLELPVVILAAAVVPAQEKRNAVGLTDLEAVLIWQLVRHTKAPMSPVEATQKLAVLLPHQRLQEATQVLLSADLIRLSPATGDLAATPGIHVQAVNTCDRVPNPSLIASMHLGATAIAVVDVARRDIHALTLGLSRDAVKEVRTLLGKVRQAITALGTTPSDEPRQLCQINWQLFPLTKPAGLEALPIPPAALGRLASGDKRSLNFIIREMVALPSFQGDPAWIAKKLYPQITPADAQRSLQILERQGMIRFAKATGRYSQVARNVQTAPLVAGLAIVDYHREMLGFAEAALSYAKTEWRTLVAMTLAIPKSQEAALRARLIDTLQHIFALAGREKNPDILYQMNLQFFPLT